ncbi:hypothetical protein QRX60_14570 [Amycolatopsis mongoliensis]|uniref:Uncharacterized protein n=1 Tax=Amycolatopsis mongoliensis TaxID=715475 RepID=A0A9Y2JUQ2_9PSEU|nr:hypothetical protein [Amycolatopsis sp. 4-36]WIY05000.1 hypothetical protein QRX60_14570 [Amycolatopsis sp. 4-36]
MLNELIRMRNGRAVLADSVTSVAKALNPLGTAAEIVATVGACTVEIGRFRLEKGGLQARQDAAAKLIHTRQRAIVGLFDTRMRDSEQIKVSLDELHHGYREMVRMACDLRVSPDERIATQGTLTILSGQIIGHHANSGDTLVRLSDSLSVADTKTAIAVWRGLDSRR